MVKRQTKLTNLMGLNSSVDVTANANLFAPASQAQYIPADKVGIKINAACDLLVMPRRSTIHPIVLIELFV